MSSVIEDSKAGGRRCSTYLEDGGDLVLSIIACFDDLPRLHAQRTPFLLNEWHVCLEVAIPELEALGSNGSYLLVHVELDALRV